MATAVAENEAAVNPGALTKALQDAQARKDALSKQLDQIKAKNDLTALISFLASNKAIPQPDGSVSFTDAEREIAHAQKAVDQAAYMRDKEQREAMRGELYKAVHAAASAFAAAARKLGITGVGVVFGEDGSATTTVAEKSAKAPSSGPKGVGGTRASGKWQFDGHEYTSRELVEVFGGPMITASVRAALDDTSGKGNWNPTLQKVARAMGWVDGGPRVLTHLPQ